MFNSLKGTEGHDTFTYDRTKTSRNLGKGKILCNGCLHVQQLFYVFLTSYSMDFNWFIISNYELLYIHH